MQIAYGSYRFPVDGTHWLAGERQLERNGVGYALHTSVVLVGTLLGTDQTNLNNQVIAMQNALRFRGRDLMLLGTSGGILQRLLNAGALTPVRCVDGPHFTGQRPAEYATCRDFTATFEAVYSLTTSVITLESVTQLRFWGGFPIIVFLPSLNGSPQKQQTVPRTTYKAIQSGRVVCRNGVIPRPDPLFSLNLLIDNPEDELTTIKTPDGFDHSRAWTYRYESIMPIG